LLALIERLLLGLGILLISFCLGIILLSSPILLVSGVFLILASEATVSSGLYYITFSILSPIILIPLFLYMSELSDSDQLMEGKFSLILLNLFVILVSLIVFGSSSIYFLGVLVAASVLTLGDLVMNKWTTNNW
jgi:hypothetical protein